MKLICISLDENNDYDHDANHLTIGKIYDADISLNRSNPLIKCDKGTPFGAIMKHFITLDEYRERQIEKII